MPLPFRRRTALVGAAAAFTLLATGAPAVAAGADPAGSDTARPVSDPAALVNPFAGTGSGGDVVGDVDTFPGASVPFGMMQFSPDTPGLPSGGGYRYTDSSITGFSLTHLSGVGCNITGDVPFLPTTGAIPADPTSAAQPFSHTRETASPGHYGVTLNPGANAIRTDITATARTGLGSFTYPRTDQARMLVKAADSQNGSSGATFQVTGKNQISGSVTSGRFCGQPDSSTVYYTATFDRPFTGSGTWGGATDQVHAGVTALTVRGTQHPATKQSSGGPASRRQAQASGPVGGGYLTFDTRKNPTVRMRVAISYVSTAGAEGNLRAEGGSWDVGRVAAAARAAWNRQLTKIAIGGGATGSRATFYTALYHSLLDPNLFSDADGRYIGFDDKVHPLRRGHAQYANFSGWDIYRSEIPLISLLAPDQTGDMMQSLVHDADQGGWLPKWPLANGYTDVMNGDAADPILAGGYAFGARGFDTRSALAHMVKGAGVRQAVARPGLVQRAPEPGRLQRARLDPQHPVDVDLAEAQRRLGDPRVRRRGLRNLTARDLARQKASPSPFSTRSQNWANLFDTATGYILPRDADGAFPSGDPTSAGGGFGQSGFQEGNAAQYTWMVPQNLRGLIDGMGGNAAAVSRLNTYFSQLNAGPNQPYHWQGNEPTFDAPWAYDTAGAPWLTQGTVRRIVDQLYSATPGGEPGNDDLGAMSSWYVWAAIGLYPQTPGVPMLVVGSPLFSSVSVAAGPGRRIEIRAPQAGTGQPYVHGLKVDGKASSKSYVMLGDRGTLRMDFALSGTPDKQWGTGKGDQPPSFGAGKVTFPAATRVAVSATPSQIRIAPGTSGAIKVVADNTYGTAPAKVTWSATAKAGLTSTPASATVTVPAKGTASGSVKITAAAGLAPGFYQVALAAKAANGAVIPTVRILVTVAQPGERSRPRTCPTTATTQSPRWTRARATGGSAHRGRQRPGRHDRDPDDAQAFVANNNTAT